MNSDPDRNAVADDVTTDGSRRRDEAASAVPLDLKHLGRFTLGNVALEAEVLGMFADHLTVYLGALANAESDKAWRDAAHTLKGAAWAIGAWKLGMAAEGAERVKVDAAAAEVRALALSAIAGAAAEVEAFIRAHLADSKAA
jgi:HPt (histidine-containing phosphotransfer) domain-containing protein